MQPGLVLDFYPLADSLRAFLKCPLLLIYAWPPSFGKETYDRTMQYMKYIGNEKLIEIKSIKSTHHFHMMLPDETSKLVID